MSAEQATTFGSILGAPQKNKTPFGATPTLKRTASGPLLPPRLLKKLSPLLSFSPPLDLASTQEEVSDETLQEDSDEEFHQLMVDQFSAACKDWLEENAAAYFKVEYNLAQKKLARAQQPKPSRVTKRVQ